MQRPGSAWSECLWPDPPPTSGGVCGYTKDTKDAKEIGRQTVTAETYLKSIISLQKANQMLFDAHSVAQVSYCNARGQSSLVDTIYRHL